MALTATYEGIMNDWNQYNIDNNIQATDNPLADLPEELPLEAPKPKSKVPPKKVLKKPDIKLKPNKSLPEIPRPPFLAASNLSEIDTSSTFIKEFTPSVEYHSKRLGLSPDLMLAQIALETGWGKSAPGYNYGGQKVGSKYKGKSQTFNTKEFVSGLGLTPVTGEKFRAYDSAEEGIKGYFDFFESYDRYKPLFGVGDPIKGADLMAKAGYATDPKYSSKLKNIVKTIQKFRKENNI